MPSPITLTSTIDDVANEPTATQKSTAAAVIDPAGALEAERDRLAVLEAVVVRLADPREQEDAVVGREPERDRKEQHRLGQLERALAAVAEDALEPAVLEDPARGSRTRPRGRARS